MSLLLRARTTTITREVFEETNTRRKKCSFIMRYNNVCIITTSLDKIYIEASPYVVDGPNGLRMNGFQAELTGLVNVEGIGLVGSYIVSRDFDVVIADDAGTTIACFYKPC